MKLTTSTSLAIAMLLPPFGALSAEDSTHNVAPAPKLIKCTAEGHEPIWIDLWTPSEFGPLHCVRGDFATDLTPCAPNGGWGLSAGTGRAKLVDVTQNWETAHNHWAGKMAAHLSPTHFSASAKFGEGLTDTDPEWGIKVSRKDGQGLLFFPQNITLNMSCTEVMRKW